MPRGSGFLFFFFFFFLGSPLIHLGIARIIRTGHDFFIIHLASFSGAITPESMVNVMLNEGLVDEIILTIFPLVLGKRIPLFAPGVTRAPFKTVRCEAYETGLIQWRLVRD